MNQIPQINAFRKAIARNKKQIKRSRSKLLSIHQKSTIRIVKTPIIGEYGKIEAIDVNNFEPIMRYGRKSF